MILENKIVESLKYFGMMNKTEIQQKLFEIGMNIEMRDLDHAIYLLKVNKLIGMPVPEIVTSLPKFVIT